jgi:hypothetical protein
MCALASAVRAGEAPGKARIIVENASKQAARIEREAQENASRIVKAAPVEAKQLIQKEKDTAAWEIAQAKAAFDRARAELQTIEQDRADIMRRAMEFATSPIDPQPNLQLRGNVRIDQQRMCCKSQDRRDGSIPGSRRKKDRGGNGRML